MGIEGSNTFDRVDCVVHMWMILGKAIEVEYILHAFIRLAYFAISHVDTRLHTEHRCLILAPFNVNLYW